MTTPIPKTITELLPEVIGTLGSSTFDEKYPHIAQKLCLFWGSEFFMDYVESLIMVVPNRQRPTRQGFPFETIKELRAIVDAHNEQYPQYARIIDLWTY